MQSIVRAITTTTLAGTVLLAGCSDPVPLVIADLQTDKVTIQADEKESIDAVFEKAREGCAVHGRMPRYLNEGKHCTSTVCNPIFGTLYCSPSDCMMHHLFACVDNRR